VARATPVQALALLAGAIFVALGVAGLASRSELLGTFEASSRLGSIQLVLGIAGLAAAGRAERARAYLLGAAVATFLLWTLGVVLRGAWLSLNPSDNWLHFLLATGLAGCAALTRATPEPGRACTQP
jgi:hypothetical protein